MMYNRKVMGIFQNPSNVGELKGVDCCCGMAVNNVFGDTVKFYIKVQDNVVIKAKFKAFGNVATIACSSIATELVLNRTLDDLKTFKTQEIIKVLDSIPESKEYSLTLVKEAIVDAVKDFIKKQARLNKQNKSAK